MESAREKIAAALATVGTWAEEKPQITEEETARTLELAKNVTSWLDGAVKEQEGKAGHEEPAFSSAQVEKKLAPLEKAVRVLGKKPKPKPPKVEEADGEGAGNGTNATEADGAPPAAEGAEAAGGEAAADADAAAGSADEKKKDEL